MAREWNLERDTDGKKYLPSDLAKVGCGECRGCDQCCREMCATILIDPWDMYMLKKGIRQDAGQLFAGMLELGQENGLILPHIRKTEETGGCIMLTEEGRCGIHEFRPGFCRLFPMARLYEGNEIFYLRLTGECPAENTTKVKVKKWLDTPELARHEEFAGRWHRLTRFLQGLFLGVYGADGRTLPKDFEGSAVTDEMAKQLNLLFLQTFYLTPYDGTADFYVQFEERAALWTEKTGLKDVS